MAVERVEGEAFKVTAAGAVLGSTIEVAYGGGGNWYEETVGEVGENVKYERSWFGDRIGEDLSGGDSGEKTDGAE